MRAEKRRHQAHRLFVGQPAIHPEQLQLGIGVESVAALALNRGDAEREHLPEKARGSLQQICLGGRPGLPHGGHYATAIARDLQIAPAAKTLLEIVGSPAGKGEMGVAVYQARNH